MKQKIKYLVLLIFAFTLYSFNTFSWPTPVLNSPANATFTFVGVTLDWSSVIGSDAYELQIDTNNSFSSPVLFTTTKNYINSNSSNTDTEHFADDLYFGTVYYWRVRAYVSGDTSAWAQQSFTTRDFVLPNTPASGMIVFAGVNLDWLAHTGVDFYDVEADTSMLFNSPMYISASNAYINSNSSNTDTEYFLDDILFGETYYWRVRARNAVDTSLWSNAWTINTIDEVLKISPATGSSTWTGLTLDWLAHAGVDFYDVEADTVLSYNSPAYKTASNAYINSNNNNSDTQYFLNDLYFGMTYYWHVRARNTIDSTSWGSDFNFSTNDFVTLVTPANGQINVSLSGTTLNWNAHPGVSLYELEFDSLPTFNSPALVSIQKNYINSNNNNTDTQNATGALVANTSYYWRVRAINAVDTSAWTTWSFSTSNCAAPDSISGAVAVCFGGTATYSVTPVAGATSYNWTLPSGWSGTSTTNSITVTVGNTGGDISVSVNNVCGVSSAQILSVSVDSLIGSIGTLSGALNVCEANIASYIIPAVPGATSYVWSTPSGWIGTSTTNNLLVTPSSISGDVSVYAINACDSTAIETITVNVTPLPPLPGVILGDTLVCNESINMFSVAPVAGAISYNWTLPSGWSGTSTANSILATAGNAGGLISVSAVNGCGNSLPSSLNISVSTVDTTVTITGVTISANATNATYQWFNCDSNQQISGEISSAFTPTVNGNYSVIIDQNGCIDTSSCIAITSVGLSEINQNLISIYPNPSSGNFIIENSFDNSMLYIYDLAGREIVSTKLTEVKKYEFHLPEGMYQVKLYSKHSFSTTPLIITP